MTHSMFMIRMAGLLIQVNNRYEHIREKCRDYIVETDEKPDLIMEASDADIEHSKAWKIREANEYVDDNVAELDSAPYNVYPELPDYQALWLHAAVVEMNGGAYAFSAPSGYGKSTHISLWKQAFGDRVRIINGDNPILRLHDGVFYAYGTPFCGKEGEQINTRIPLRGICFLHHAEQNAIHHVEPAAALMRLMADNWTISTAEQQEKHLCLYEELVTRVPVYLLMCNQDVGAAHVAWEGMQSKE